MKLVALIKQVPDTTKVRIDPKTNTLVREGVASIMNPYDQFSLEEAVRLKDENPDSELTVISMGPPQARKALLKALALGADRAILLSDRAFAGSDTWATSLALAHALKTIGEYDVIFCGLQAIDGDTGQVGPETAQILDIPQVTYVESVTRKKNKISVIQQTEDGTRRVEVETPVLITLIPTPDFIPRIPPFPGIVRSTNKPYEIWDARTVGANQDDLGLNGSPTMVLRTYSPLPRGEVEMIKGDTRTLISQLVRMLIDRNIVNPGVKS